jgi:hypothetical protein
MYIKLILYFYILISTNFAEAGENNAWLVSFDEGSGHLTELQVRSKMDELDNKASRPKQRKPFRKYNLYM